jgi:hypothetical protein
MFASLSSGRVTTTPTSQGICIIIRPLFDWRIAFFTVWLVGWVVMPWKTEVNAIKSLYEPSPVQWFALLWGVGWLLGIVFVSQHLLWTFGGRETLEITPTELSLVKSVFGISVRKWKISVTEVRNLRFIPAHGYGKRRVASRIAFEYGSKTIHFGVELEDGKALAIIDSMLGVYSFPKRDRSLEYLELPN